jgi:peroxiredoxin Q/BCP
MSGHNFTLTDHHGDVVSSADLAGRRTVVFFYPKAMTPGCTAEACDFRDRYAQFQQAGYAVVGISPDPPEANARFAQQHGLTFPLLSDPDHAVAARFGAWGTKKNYGREYEGLIRSTFVLGPDGTVEREWRNVRASGHVARVARDLGLEE